MDNFLDFLNERFGLADLVEEGIKFESEDGKLYLLYNGQMIPVHLSEEDDVFLTVNNKLKKDKTAIYNGYFSSEKNRLMEFKILKLKSAKHRDSPFITKHKYALNGDGFKIEISKMSVEMVISFFNSQEYVGYVKNRIIQRVERYLERVKDYESRGKKATYITALNFSDLFIKRLPTAKVFTEDKWPNLTKQLEINLRNLRLPS